MIHQSDCQCPDCGRMRARLSRKIQRQFALPPSAVKERDLPDLLGEGRVRSRDAGPRRQGGRR